MVRRTKGEGGMCLFISQANILWWDKSVTIDPILRIVRPNQRVNKFPAMREVCGKVPLGRQLKRMTRLLGNNGFEFVPRTICVPAEKEVCH